MPPGRDVLAIEPSLRKKGSRHEGFLHVPGSGRTGNLPVIVLAGEREGPTVWVTASIHGDEYLGAAALARLLPSLDPASMTGNVIATPVLNVPAFREMHRTDPAHDLDMNRVWTARKGEGATLRTRDRVAAEILERSDLVVDLHSGGNRFLQAPFTIYPAVGGEVETTSASLAKACGLPLIWADDTKHIEGALIHAAARKRKPAVLVEVAGEGKAEEHWVVRVAAAVRSLLVQAGVLPGRSNFLDEYRVFREFSVVKGRAEGLWQRRMEPLEDVARDEALGRVFDPFGGELETVRSPVDGVILGMYTYGFVAAGETISELGHEIRTEGPPA